MYQIHLKIEGRVQRVGFRRWVISKAIEIGGISGWVKNLDDGSVEILMNGEEQKINKLIQLCYTGPFLARVDKISFLTEINPEFLPPIRNGVFLKI